MGITTTTEAGRAKLAHPDLSHEGGSGLWNKVHTMFAKISNSLATQWFGPYTVADTGTQEIIHNFDMNLSELDVRIVESDVLLTQEQQSVYGIAETGGNLKNSITITNNSGGSKTFDVYVLGFSLDKMLGRQKGRVTTSGNTTTTLITIPIPTGESMALDVMVAVRKDGTNANLYRILAVAENNAGTAAVRISSTTEDEDVSIFSATLDVSGGDVRVRVTGDVATSLEWYGVVQKTYF